MSENISFIRPNVRKQVDNDIVACNRSLLSLQNLVEGAGETLEDAIKYQEEGWDYIIRQKREECEKWMSRLQMPSYLHESNIKQAVESLGSERLDYFARVGRMLPIHYSKMTIDLSKDVEVKEGIWTLTEDFKNARIKEQSRTLTDAQMKDLELLIEAGRLAKKLKSYGYDIDGLDFFAKDKPKEELAEGLCNTYNYLKDERVVG